MIEERGAERMAEDLRRMESLRAVSKAQGWATLVMIVSVMGMAFRPWPSVEVMGTISGGIGCMVMVLTAQWRYRETKDDSGLWMAVGAFFFLAYGFHSFAIGRPAILGIPGAYAALIISAAWVGCMVMVAIRGNAWSRDEARRLLDRIDAIEARVDEAEARYRSRK